MYTRKKNYNLEIDNFFFNGILNRHLSIHNMCKIILINRTDHHMNFFCCCNHNCAHLMEISETVEVHNNSQAP